MRTLPKRLPLALASLLLVIGCAKPAHHAATAPASMPAPQAAADGWEKEISAFEAADRATPMPKGSIVFYGSSSIRFWSSLAHDFPGKPVFNRGFGGSQMSDAVRYLDRVVIPNQPRTIVIYEGDNDLAAGQSPQRVVSDAREIIRRVHAELPRTRILFLSIKYSPSRIHQREKIKTTNAMLRAIGEAEPMVDYVDVATPMLGADGEPRPELFRPDMLHMKPEGYAIWTEVLKPLLD
jgi:lysophospholipase L1-like esterase